MRLSILAFVFIGIGIATAGAQDPHPKLKPLEFRIGKWTADVEVNGQVVGTSTTTWSWILNSQYMQSVSEVSLPDYGYEVQGMAVWGWSPEKNAVQVTDFNSNGESRQFVVEVQAGKVISPAAEGNELGVVKVVEEFGDDGPKTISGLGADGNAIWKVVNFKKK